MTVGEKIKIGRTLRGYTQNYLGLLTHLSDVRIRQYELGIRKPKDTQLSIIADALGIPIEFFGEHATDSEADIMHVLFELDALRGISLRADNGKCVFAFRDAALNKCLVKWCEKKDAFEAGRLSREDYDLWRARFPLSDG